MSQESASSVGFDEVFEISLASSSDLENLWSYLGYWSQPSDGSSSSKEVKILWIVYALP